MPWILWAPDLPWLRTGLAAFQHGRRLRLNGNNLHVRVELFQTLADARHRSAGTHAGYEDIDLAVGVVPNLLTRGLIVPLRIGGVLKLLQDDAAGNGIAQALSLCDGTLHAGCPRGEHHLCPIGLHQVAALHAHRLGHGEYELIAFHGRDQCQSNASVAARGLDDGGPGLQFAVALGCLNHGQGYAVFHAAAGIEKLHLCNDGLPQPAKGGILIEFDQWRVAYEVGYLLEYSCHNLFL